MAIQTATNPKTGERIALINGSWVPFTQSATNAQGQKAFLVGGKWATDGPVATPKPPEESGFLRQVADVPVGVARGVAVGVRMVADAFGANNPVSNSIKGVEGYLSGLLSAQAKQDEQEISRIMQEAEDKGVLEQVKAGFRAFATAPIDLLSQGLGTAAPAILATLGGKVLGAGALATRALGAGVGAGMGSGAVKGQIYESVKEALTETGMSPEQVEARAQLAQSYGGQNLDMILTGAALGGLASSVGIEPVLSRLLARRIIAKTGAGEAAEEAAQRGVEQVVTGPGFRRTLSTGASRAAPIVTGAVAEALPEIAQGSQEQLAQNLALQREGFDVPTLRGVAGAGTLEGLAGAGLGAGVAAATQLPARRPQGEEPQVPDVDVEPPPDVDPAGVASAPADAELDLPAPKAQATTTPVGRFSDEDLIATGIDIPPASLPLIRRLAVGKTREELQGFVAENPELLEGDSASSRVIRSLVAEPVRQPDQIAVEPPDVRTTGTPQPAGVNVAGPVAGPAVIPAQAPTPAITDTPSGTTTPETIEAETQRPEVSDPTVPVIEDVETPVTPSDSWNTMDQQVRTQVAQAAGLKKPENFASKKWGSLPKDARTKLTEAIATQEASAAPPAGEGRVQSIEEADITSQIADLEKQRRKIERSGVSLLGTLRRIGMREEDLKDVYGRKIPLSAQSLRYKDRPGTSISTLVANGTLDAWLPYSKRIDAVNFDGQEAEQIIKDRLGEKRFLTEDTEMDMRRLNLYIEDLEQALKLEDINAELEIATQEQRGLDQEAETDAARPEDRAAGRAQEAQTGEAAPDLQLTPPSPETFQAEEDRAKQAAAEEARAAEEAEKAKAEADKERERKEIEQRSAGAAEDFQLGQDAEANLTGQKDIFAQPPELQVSPEKEKEQALKLFSSKLFLTTAPFKAKYANRTALLRPKPLSEKQQAQLEELASKAIDLGLPASTLSLITDFGATGMSGAAAMSESGSFLLSKQWAAASESDKLSSFVHELAHAIDFQIAPQLTGGKRFSAEAKWSAAHDELKGWYDKNPFLNPLAYPFAKQFSGTTNLKMESFAQAVALYITAPDRLQNNAPEAYSQVQAIVEGIQNESKATSATGAAKTSPSGVNVRQARTGKDSAVQPAAGKVGTGVSKVARSKDRAAEQVTDDSQEVNLIASPIADPDAAKGKEAKEAVENSRESILFQPIDGTWNTPMDPKPLKLSDEFFYNWVDKQVDLKRVVDAIGATGKRVAGKFNALERERTYHGRVADRTTKYLTGELQPTLDLMKKYGITQREMGEYLLNRHAPEANKVIADRNPRFPDAGSSVKTADAIKYMENLEPLRKRQLDAVAKRMDKTLIKMQDMLVEYGIETQDTIDGWRDMFQHYIPLVRDDADYSINKVMSQGAGYSRSGDTSKSRTGSAKEVNLDEIFSNIAMQHERMIVRAEGNRIGQALFGLALTEPNPGFWLALDPETNVIWKTIKELEDIKADRDLIKEMLDSGELTPSQDAEYRMELDLIRKIIKKKEQPARAAFAKARDDLMELGFNPAEASKLTEQLMMPPMKARYNKEKNEVVYEPNSAVNNEFVFSTRINGSDKFVLFNGNNERANRMVRGLKNMDAENLSEAMNIAAKITRFFAAINTQYNPVFGAYNFLRDVQTAALQISTTEIADKRSEVINGTPAALKAIFQVARARRSGKKITGEMARDFAEFESEGGQTGFRDLYSQSEERATAIQRQIDPASWADSKLGNFFTAGGTLKVPFETMRKGAAPLFNLLSDYNQSLENAVRLSAYRVAREKFKSQGLSPADAKQKAATIAKDITVNFNQKGIKATQMGALFAFFNASVQGTTMMARTLSGPLGRKIIAGGMLWGVIQTILLAEAGFDDEEPPEFVKQRNFILPYGLIVPGAEGKYVAFPMPLGFNVIPTLGRLATEAVITGGENVSGKAVNALDAVMDMFNPIGNAGLSFQTITPTMLDPLVALSENKSWTGQSIAREDFSGLNPTPGFARSRDSANAISKELARLLNAMSGGNEDRKGFISPTADQLEYLVGQLTGGVGRELMKAGKTVEATITGEELPSYSVPLVGRFHGNINEMAAVSSAFYRNLTELNIQKNEIQTIRDNKGNMQAYLAENPEARLVQMATAQYNQVKKLRKLRQAALEKDDKERAKQLEEAIKIRMLRLNDRYEEVTK